MGWIEEFKEDSIVYHVEDNFIIVNVEFKYCNVFSLNNIVLHDLNKYKVLKTEEHYNSQNTTCDPDFKKLTLESADGIKKGDKIYAQ